MKPRQGRNAETSRALVDVSSDPNRISAIGQNLRRYNKGFSGCLQRSGAPLEIAKWGYRTS